MEVLTAFTSPLLQITQYHHTLKIQFLATYTANRDWVLAHYHFMVATLPRGHVTTPFPLLYTHSHVTTPT